MKKLRVLQAGCIVCAAHTELEEVWERDGGGLLFREPQQHVFDGGIESKDATGACRKGRAFV